MFTCAGGFIINRHKIPEIVVPNLEGFEVLEHVLVKILASCKPIWREVALDFYLYVVLKLLFFVDLQPFSDHLKQCREKNPANPTTIMTTTIVHTHSVIIY